MIGRCQLLTDNLAADYLEVGPDLVQVSAFVVSGNTLFDDSIQAQAREKLQLFHSDLVEVT